MLTLLGITFSCFFLASWGSVSSSLIMLSLVSLLGLCNHFSLTGNLSFLSTNVSALLILLSCLLCFLSLQCTSEVKSKFYVTCILSLGLFLLLAFSQSNSLMFYIFFEASLIPTLLLIVGWGYQPERLQAGTYMMLYTVGASLPFLVLLIWQCINCGTMNMIVLGEVSMAYSGLLSFIVFGAFLVKLPMYTTHLWLPKAHVEAPLAGSMLLAGILLKLGGYGIMMMSMSFNFFMSNASWVLLSLIMWGGLLATMMCLRQVDVKALVAFSSVGHMSIVAAGLMMDHTWGVLSAMITMVAHGFSSSALFCLAYFSYSKSHTRNIPYMKGMLVLYPVMSFWWFVFCCINMAAPPTLNLLGELSIVPVLWNASFSLALTMALMVFFSASYNMYLYTSINHGSNSSYLTAGVPLKSSWLQGLLLHSIPLALILKCNLFMYQTNG
uniref:NADH-ubiquinone oxidoreductase chain 4 n=1 Tax=Micromelo undatus TaxID=340426 RepID=E6Y190_MICUD|nr:NADH dehydrogenase subunit 4 [Micromelo undatus]ABK92263.1 NADH dehydrogenase subunit 4 [Micromelo undatus]